MQKNPVRNIEPVFYKQTNITPTLAIADNGNRYRVVVSNTINGTTTAANSTAATLTVEKSPLNAPTAITAQAVSGSTTSITVTFTNASNATGYTAQVFLASDGTTKVGSDRTSFTSGGTISGLSAGTAYKVKLISIGDASYADSSPSALSSTVTTNAAAVAATITNPSSTSKLVGQTNIFSAAGTAASDGGTLTYQWQISTDSGTTFSNISGATSVNYTTPTLAIADNGNRYRAVVSNTINGTTTAANSTAATLTVTKNPLSPPTAITPRAVSGSSTSITVTFTTASNATGYTAQVFLASDGTTQVGSDRTSFTSGGTISGLSAGTAYKIKLISIGDASYADSSPSDLSSTVTTNKAEITTPTAPTVESSLSTRKYISVSWSSVANSTSYTLKLYDSSGSNLLATISSVSGTSRAITASDYASIADETGYRVSLTAIGNTQYFDSEESAKSSLVTTRIADAESPAISSQPTNVSAAATQTATFTLTASAPGGGTLSYQWQISTDGGTSWSSVSSGTGATSSSYTTATLATSQNGRKYRVVVTNTRGTTTSVTNSSAVTLTVGKANQSALTLTSTTGTFGTPTTLTTSGGTTSGSVTFTITSGGSAAGCSITSGALSTGSTGTCRVIATMAGNDEYNAVSSDATTVTFSATAQSSLAVLTVAPTAIYQGSNNLIVGVGTAGTVDFLQEGRLIPGCSAIKATITSAATCNWKPSRLGMTKVEAILTPTSGSFAIASSGLRAVTVVPRE